MVLADLLAHHTKEIARLHGMKSVITQRGMRMRSRWGREPFVDTTDSWLAELDRRIVELETIDNDIRAGRFN